MYLNKAISTITIYLLHQIFKEIAESYGIDEAGSYCSLVNWIPGGRGGQPCLISTRVKVTQVDGARETPLRSDGPSGVSL